MATLKFFAVLSVSAVLLQLVACDQVEIDLTGDAWTLTEEGGRVKDIPAVVPGQVHLDLLRAKVIDDPYDGWNDWLLQWVAYANWIYSRPFSLQENMAGKRAYLSVDGLDTVAAISVNGKLAGKTRNMHRRHYFDITELLAMSDKNSISITLNSSANYSAQMATAYPYTLPGGGEFFNGSHRNFVRKTQSDFGWDWGPAFIPSGITGNISVLLTDGVYVTHISPKTYYDGGLYGINVTVCLVVASSNEDVILSLNYSLVEPDIGNYQDRTFLSPSPREVCYSSGTEIKPSIMEPDYIWWPTGVSHSHTSPTLVTVLISINITHKSSSKTLWKSSMASSVGFRRIDLIEDPVGKNGQTFFFQLSTDGGSYPIFAKGSNFIPMDAFVNRATPKVARRLLTSAVQGHQNMVRVWGGGLYQPDWFYALCDELGIMIWQEFMFADALYPRDKDFLAEVELEVQDVVRRLGNHPSIVLWSGNNENQALAEGDPAHLIDYSVLYDMTVRATLWREDTSRLYWPSSPSNGVLVDDSERGLFIQRWGDSGSSSYGDTHRYDYTDLCTDVTKFPRPRFASEFGFQGYPSFGSLSSISSRVDWSNDSPLMLHRQHHPHGNEEMDAQMRLLFHPPNNTDKADRFRDFVYLSQIVQGICIKSEAEHYRRFISNETVLTRGTLYWQLNDIWQAQSWSSIEWSGQWKVLHYYMKSVYQQVSISSVAEDEGVGIYVIVDVSDWSIKYDLTVKVLSWKGNVVQDLSRPGITSKGFTGERVWFEKNQDIFKGIPENEAFLHYSIRTDGASADGYHFPINLNNVTLDAAVITPSLFALATPTKVNFTLSSTAVAPYVYLESLNTPPGTFSDNGFLLMKGSSQNVSFDCFEQIDLHDFVTGLSIRSLQDTYSGKPY